MNPTDQENKWATQAELLLLASVLASTDTVAVLTRAVSVTVRCEFPAAPSSPSRLHGRLLSWVRRCHCRHQETGAWVMGPHSFS